MAGLELVTPQHPRSLVPFALALACAALAAACGSPAPGVAHPSGDAAGQAPEAAPEVGASPDAGGSPEAPAAVPDAAADVAPPPPIDGGPRDARAEIPTLPDAGIAGACGTPNGPKCPVTYVGTSMIRGNSNGLTAALAPDGALYLGGSFFETTDFDPTAGMDVRMRQGTSDAFLTKQGPAGAYAFTDTFPGSEANGATIGDIAASAGSVVVSGWWDGEIDLDPGTGVDVHAHDFESTGSFVVKLTPTGAFVWSRVLSQTTTSGASWGQVAAALDGTTYATGGFFPGVDLDPGPAVHKAPSVTHGVFITRLDDMGNPAWYLAVGGDACEWTGIGSAVAVAPDGSLWFASTYKGRCAFDQGGPSTVDGTEGLLLASVGSDGKVRSLRTITGNVAVTGIATTPDGSLYVAGSAGAPGPGQSASVDFDPSTAVVSHLIPISGTSFVLKLDQMGMFRWVQLYPGDMLISAVGGAPDNGLIVAGKPRGYLSGMFLLQLGADQREAWRLEAPVGGAWATDVLVDAKGFTLTGYSARTGDFDPTGGVDHLEGNLLFMSRYKF